MADGVVAEVEVRVIGEDGEETVVGVCVVAGGEETVLVVCVAVGEGEVGRVLEQKT